MEHRTTSRRQQQDQTDRTDRPFPDDGAAAGETENPGMTPEAPQASARRRRAARYETAEPENETPAAGFPEYGSETAREVASRYRQRQDAERREQSIREGSLAGTRRLPVQGGSASRKQVGYEPGRMGMTPAQRARMSEEGRARLAMESGRAGRTAEERTDPRKKTPAKGRGRDGGRPVITTRPSEKPRRGRKILIILAVAVLIIGALAGGLMLVPDGSEGFLGSLKQRVTSLFGREPQQTSSVLSFEKTAQDSETAPAVLLFSVRTTKDVADVLIRTENGDVLPTTCQTKGDATLERTLTWKTESPYEGELKLEVLEADGWKATDFRLTVQVQPGPEGTAEPQPDEETIPDETEAEDSGAAATEQTEAAVRITAEPEITETVTAEPEPAETAGEETAAPEAPAEDMGEPEDGEEDPWEDEAPEDAAILYDPAQDEDAVDMTDGDETGAAEDEADAEIEPEETAAEEFLPDETADADTEPAETADAEPAENTDAGKTAAAAEPAERTIFTVTAAESADPSLISTTVVYNGTKKVAEYARADSEKIHMPVLGEYTRQKMGILTFRTDAFRQNAAVGSVKGLNNLTLAWTADAGSVKGSGQTYYGVGWGSQPAIMKWSIEVRNQSDMYDAKKEKDKLKEVIVAGQDGRIYFLDLTDGTPTRNSIKLGFPMRGTPSIHPGGAPYMTVGQFARKMASRTGTIGLRQYNLYSMKELSLIDGLDAKNNRPFNKVGSFETSALIDRTSGPKVMVTAGTNGMLYLINLNCEFDYNAGVYTQSPTMVVMRSKAKGEKDAYTAVEASVAMYDRYVYYADMGGYLRCVDTNTLKVAWAVALGDSVESTPALDWHGEDGLDLYTATLLSLRKKGDAEIKCLDALSGEVRWTASFGVKKDTKNKTASGFRASPVIGQNGLSEFLYYTVNGLSEEGRSQLGLGSETAAVIALRKSDGSVVWSKGLSGRGYSSPVAVYDKEGNGAIIQCAGDGSIRMLDGLTGEELAFLQVDGAIEASPAVYDGMMVIGTSERNKNSIYGIMID